MSFHVYIARPGFKETPIDEAEWIAAARESSDLFVGERSNPVGRKIYSVHLKGRKSERLHHTPYGLIHAQAPSRELVTAMFVLANALDAGVYSERLKPYASVDDWSRRTKKYRERREANRVKQRDARRKKLILWAILAIASALAGCLAAARHAA